MFPDASLPVSLMAVLFPLSRCCTAPAFRTFCGLVAGLTGQVRRRTVVGMLLGACLAWPHDRAHYFFSRARWEIDAPAWAAPASRRAANPVQGPAWQHDGSARNKQKLSFGNCFVTAGIVVVLPSC